MDDQNTTATNPPEQAAEPDQQLLRAASPETDFRRRRPRTARMSTGAGMRRSYNQVSQGVTGANPIPAEADMPRSPRRPAANHTANINNDNEIDGRRTTATNQPQQAAEQPTVSQQLLCAPSAETRRRSRFTTIRISTRGGMHRRRSLSPEPVMRQPNAHGGGDRPVVSQGVTTINQPQQTAEQPAISQRLLWAAEEETRRRSRSTMMRISTLQMNRVQNLGPDPVLWEYYVNEGDDRPMFSEVVAGTNPTPTEADRPRSPRRYPQLAEISRPRPIPLIERRWFRPPLLSLIPLASNDSEQPPDRHQPHQHQQHPELPDQ
ncbi:uncharacterized protein LOC114128987 [Aphis gossypii]|uniref:Uncharacterized protein n=1 Tax=Aphis gossypii TaxID=80765 RepID=A0A9P0IX66_APHGO|nr:uncharacterized protein LOC114128987 [Aphis gossypii]CAH1721258.1 unnamed protein product [Aphis gossypii]